MTGSHQDPEAIAEEVRATRKARHWRQADLAERAHLSVKTIRNVEAGRPASAATYQQIFRALRMDPAPEWSPDVRAATQAIGHMLEAMPAELRPGTAAELVAVIVKATAAGPSAASTRSPDRPGMP